MSSPDVGIVLAVAIVGLSGFFAWACLRVAAAADRIGDRLHDEVCPCRYTDFYDWRERGL